MADESSELVLYREADIRSSYDIDVFGNSDTAFPINEASSNFSGQADKENAPLDYSEKYELVNREETLRATSAICAELGHQEFSCRCEETKQDLEKMKHVAFAIRRNNALEEEYWRGMRESQITRRSRIIVNSSRVEGDDVGDLERRLEERRELKANLFRQLGIVRDVSELNEAKEQRQEDVNADASLVGTYCALCCQNFSSCKMLLLHNTKKHGRTTMECNVCGKLLKTTSAFNKHTKTHNGNVAYHINCEFCDRKFKSKQALLTHVKVSHGDEKYNAYRQNKSVLN